MIFQDGGWMGASMAYAVFIQIRSRVSPLVLDDKYFLQYVG